MFLIQIENLMVLLSFVINFFSLALVIHFVWCVTEMQREMIVVLQVFQLSEALQYYNYYCANMRNDDAKACRIIASKMHGSLEFCISFLYKHQTHLRFFLYIITSMVCSSCMSTYTRYKLKYPITSPKMNESRPHFFQRKRTSLVLFDSFFTAFTVYTFATVEKCFKQNSPIH